jgi:predicted nucleic acid-binding protein
MTVFVDTSAFLAVLAADDEYHTAAAAIWRRLISDEEPLVTNNYVLVETVALLQRRVGLQAVRAFQSKVMPSLLVRWVDETLHEQALTSVLSANRRNLSLVDCTSFQTMRQDGINRAFTFDQHFAEQGFERLTDEHS